MSSPGLTATLIERDIVIAEGFTNHTVPKIEVFRPSEHERPHYDPSRPNAGDWFAMVTDDRIGEFPFPVFRFSDTAWLVTISSMAWENAMPIDL